MIILGCFGGTTILGNTHICINTWKPARQSNYWTPPHKSGAKTPMVLTFHWPPPASLGENAHAVIVQRIAWARHFPRTPGMLGKSELQQFGGLFILLMVQKSQGQPPRMVLKPCKSWDFNYQPQLVSWSRISGCHQQCDTKPKNALTIFAILILPKITRDSLYQVYFLPKKIGIIHPPGNCPISPTSRHSWVDDFLFPLVGYVIVPWRVYQLVLHTQFFHQAPNHPHLISLAKL